MATSVTTVVSTNAMAASSRVVETAVSTIVRKSASTTTSVALSRAATTNAALTAAGRLFEVAGTRSAAADLRLDRHWRNARTLASHNPAMYKARALGDLLLSGERLPANGFF